MAALAITFVSMTLAAIGLSWRWPLQLDGPLIQYIAFLIDHGKVPYKDIIDLNGIGSYFSSYLEQHLFGYSNLAWRIFDLLFLFAGSIGIFLIAKPFNKVAGIISSCLFILLHLREGIVELGQRDFQTAALALLGCGLLLHGLRTHKRIFLFLSGAAVAAGATIKPSAVVFVGAIAIFVFLASWFGNERLVAEDIYFVAGAATIGALAFSYLFFKGAWWSFVDLYRELLPVYSRMSHRNNYFLRHVLDVQVEPLKILIGLAVVQLLMDIRYWRRKEAAILFIGIGCAAVSYFVQGKGFWYHSDPLNAFLCVWCGIAATVLLADQRRAVRLPVAIVLAYWVVTWFPSLYQHIGRQGFDPKPLHALEKNIVQLRAEGKNNGIQVMDTTFGAIHALYELRIVQSTGFIYDFYFYNLPEEKTIADLRARFLNEMTTSRPDLLVITLQSWPQPGLGYTRMDSWPDFKNFLQANYHMASEGEFYRIYVHN